jgi:hypothetical protein
MVYSWAEHVFILEHYFALKLYAAVHEAFSSTKYYNNSKTSNKILGHRKCLWQETCKMLCNIEETLARTQQLLYCKSPLVSTFLGRTFGNGDLQTLPCKTSSCGHFSKKEFIQIMHKAWTNWNTILSRLLPTMTQKHFEKWQYQIKSRTYHPIHPSRLAVTVYWKCKKSEKIHSLVSDREQEILWIKVLRTWITIYLYFRRGFLTLVKVQTITFMIRIFVWSTTTDFYRKNNSWVL